MRRNPVMQPIQRPGLLAVVFDRPSRAISSAILGGGFATPRSWICAQVPGDYSRLDPAADLQERAAALALPGPTLGMMTAVELTTHRLTTCGLVSVLATVGVGHAASAGGAVPLGPTGLVQPGALAAAEPRPLTATTPLAVGTINLLVLVDAFLDDRTLIEAAAVAVEAKVAGLADASVRTAAGEPASGTPSDALAIVGAAAGERPAAAFSGTSTQVGAAIGRAVRRAIAEGARADRDAAVAARWR